MCENIWHLRGNRWFLGKIQNLNTNTERRKVIRHIFIECIRKMSKDVPKVHPNPYHYFLICKQLGFLMSFKLLEKRAWASWVRRDSDTSFNTCITSKNWRTCSSSCLSHPLLLFFHSPELWYRDKLLNLSHLQLYKAKGKLCRWRHGEALALPLNEADCPNRKNTGPANSLV